MDFMLRRLEADATYIRIDKNSKDPDLSIGNFKSCKDYKYLGSIISEKETFKKTYKTEYN